jgi:hypothetical protein
VNLKLSLIAAATSALLAAPAFAFPDSLGTCSFSDVKAAGADAADCRGAFPGNDLGVGADPGLGATTDYINMTWGTSSRVFSFYGELEGPSDDDMKMGQITLPKALKTPFVVSIKGSTQFALYYFESSNGATMLDFSTAALTTPGGTQPGWSHSGLWITPVPEPGTYALMLAGLGIVGFIASRRRREG